MDTHHRNHLLRREGRKKKKFRSGMFLFNDAFWCVALIAKCTWIAGEGKKTKKAAFRHGIALSSD